MHVGFPKTGTTTLQRYLFSRLQGIEYWGKEVESTQFDALNDFIFENDEGVLNTNLLSQEKDTLLISNEDYTHPKVATSLFSVATDLGKLYPDAKIIIVIRNQLDFVKSWFNAGFEHSSVSFSEFIANFSDSILYKSGALNYDEIVYKYQEVFGVQSVKVIPFELLKFDPNVFYAEISETIGLDKDEVLSLVSGKHTNHPKSTLYLFVKKIYESSLGRFVNINSLLPGSLLLFLKNFIRKIGQPAHVEYTDNQLKRIHDSYAASNIRLSNMLKSDLKKFNYPMGGL